MAGLFAGKMASHVAYPHHGASIARDVTDCLDGPARVGGGGTGLGPDVAGSHPAARRPVVATTGPGLHGPARASAARAAGPAGDSTACGATTHRGRPRSERLRDHAPEHFPRGPCATGPCVRSPIDRHHRARREHDGTDPASGGLAADAGTSCWTAGSPWGWPATLRARLGTRATTRRRLAGRPASSSPARSPAAAVRRRNRQDEGNPVLAVLAVAAAGRPGLPL